MKTRTLKQRILTAFTGIIVLLAVCILVFGLRILQKEVFSRTQRQIARSLNSARIFYLDEIDRIGSSLQAADLKAPDSVVKEKLSLDYFFRIPAAEAMESESMIVRHAAQKQQPQGGTRIIDKDELAKIGGQVQQRTQIPILETPKARPTNLKMLDSAMAKEYALPVKDLAGNIVEYIYGGRGINQDFVLVDRIRKLVFGDELYDDKPLGAVTIFQDDVRISTNVVDEKGRRAVGTRVSEEVYREVVENGSSWLDRAFVVTSWYKTGYEPIYNVEGGIIGILYVGILEEPFTDMTKQILLTFGFVIILASGLSFVLSVILAGSIVKPITHLTAATHKMAKGQLEQQVKPDAAILELDYLAESFNNMSIRLQERESHLTQSNEKLEDLNKSYMDLLGFVAHELKGLLSSAVINAYSLRDGFLGMINFKQKKAVDSICRNLDFLDATVKKFLNLSRIERGNLDVYRTSFNLKKDIFDVSVETFAKLQSTKNMEVTNEIDPDLEIKADHDLMQIVANNLVNNAIKYGTEGGQVRITSKDKGGFVTIEVYNDSRPITDELKNDLFKKFSRLDVPEKKKVKGSGLGLYITKQIVESHGGNIRVEAREKGNSFIFTISKEGMQ